MFFFRIFCFLCCFCCAAPSVAQESTLPPAVDEVGVRLTGLDNFTLLYKRQLTTDRYLRFDAVFGNLGFNTVNGATVTAFNVGTNVTWERRAPINDRLDFVRGPSAGLNFGLVGADGSTTAQFGFSLGYLLGVQYYLNETFCIGVDIIPRAAIQYQSVETIDAFSFNLGLSNTGAGISSLLRF